MNKILMIIGAVVLAVVVAAGSFYGGMAYQRNQADQTRANFLRSRGLDPNAAQNGSQNGSNSGGTRQGFFGGGTTGQVKSIEGNVLTLSTAQNVTTVNLSNSTVIEKSVQGSTSDLQPGERVLVAGQRDSQGNITAAQITILPSTSNTTGTTP